MSTLAATLPTDAQKAAVWEAYRARRPTRVPVTLWTNPRVVLCNPQWNPDGVTFEQAAQDPQTHVRVNLQHQLYTRRVTNRHTDGPTELPDVWTCDLWVYNVYEAAQLNAEVKYEPGQVPCTEPWLTDDRKHEVFDIDISRPLESPFIAYWLGFWKQMEKACAGMTFEGRPVKLAPWSCAGSDGPMTVGCNLRGTDFLMDLLEDPDYAQKLMAFITEAAILRRRAFWDYWGHQGVGHNGLADDSCAMLSVEQYRTLVMPHHRRYYDAFDAEPRAKRGSQRGMHLCGDATHLFPTIHRELGVTNFDTGFPVDHGKLRAQLGPDVEILGGPEVALLMHGSPEQVSDRARAILASGVKAGGRFILREGNNLPPLVPEANLAAMYAACLEHGRCN